MKEQKVKLERESLLEAVETLKSQGIVQLQERFEELGKDVRELRKEIVKINT